MRRLLLSALLTLFIVANADAATIYANNTRRYKITPSAQASGALTFVAASYTPDTGYTAPAGDNDAQVLYCGVTIQAGTSASTNTNYKITNYVKSTETYTVSAETGTLPALDGTTELWITTGCNVNTGLSETPGSSTTGPTYTIQEAMTNGGAAGANTVYVKYSGLNYTEEENQSTTKYVIYSTSHNGMTFEIEGYQTTPGDGCGAANLTLASTYNTTAGTWSPNYGKLTVAAGETLVTGAFPVIKSTDGTRCVRVTGSITGTPSITFRFCSLQHDGTTNIIATNSDTASVAFDRCLIGTAGGTTCFYDSSSSGTSKTFSFTKCYVIGAVNGIRVTTAAQLTVTDSYIYTEPTVGTDFPIYIDGTPATTLVWSATPTRWLPTAGVLAANIDSNRIYNNGSSTITGDVIRLNNNIYADHIKITRNKIQNSTRGWCVATYGITGLALNGNIATSDNATSSGGFWVNGFDTTVYTYGNSSRYRTLRRNILAGGASTTSATLDASAGSSTTNDVYKYRSIRITDATDGTVYVGQITAFNGTTKVATITPAASFTPASGDPYEVFEDVIASRECDSNYHTFAQDTASNNHNIMIGHGLGTDHVVVTNNTMLGGSIAYVIKGEDCILENNKGYSGSPAMLFKGGNYAYARNNTMVAGRNQTGSSGVLAVQDTSDSASGLQQAEQSKAIGLNIKDNIFQLGTAAANNTLSVVYDRNDGAGGWNTQQSRYPLIQSSILDYNVYHNANTTTTTPFSLNNTTYATFALYAASWATHAPLFAGNDSHSVAGTISFTSPDTGDFRVKGGTAANTLGSDGNPVGAGRVTSGMAIGR